MAPIWVICSHWIWVLLQRRKKNKKIHTIIVHLDDFDAIVGKIVMIASSPFINSAARKKKQWKISDQSKQIKVRNLNFFSDYSDKV